MYIKLAMAGTSNTNGGTSALSSIWTTIGNFITGVWTSPSQITSSLITKESSVVSGTKPTSGIYVSTNISATTSESNWRFTKFHYAKGQNSGAFLASSKFAIYWDTSYGLRIGYTDALDSNAYPTSSFPQTYVSSNGSSAASRWTPGSNDTDLINSRGINVIHVIATDHVFVMQIQTNGNSTQKDYGTFMIGDLEYIPAIDNYSYSSNSRYTPQIYAYWFWPNTMDQGNGVGTVSENATGLYRTNYMDQYGTYRNTPLALDYAGTAHYGNQTGNSLAPCMHPRPMNRVYQIPVTSGDYAHQLIPLMYNGHSDSTDNFGDPRNSRIMSSYRTSEDLGFTGDIITEGSGNFRIFRVHKCGSSNPASAPYNACYAFPEFNIPYGS